MYCLIIKDNDKWRIFTNEIWDSEKEATDMLKEITLKSLLNGKLYLMIINTLNVND